MVTLQDVENIYNLIVQKEGLIVPSKFSYGLSRNKSRMKEITDALIILENPYKEFEKERIEMCKSLADKDEKGNVVFENNSKGEKKI